jgi:hypothetical protein
MPADEDLKSIWRDLAEGRLTEEAAEAAAESVQARRDRRQGNDPPKHSRPPAGFLGPPGGLGVSGGRAGASRRREKMFGLGRPRALDRNAKVRIMHWARVLSRRTEKGRAYGVVTAKALAVLEALLWAFHNAKSGLCFPSYETIAAAAGCARSTVAEALHALEAAGIMTWVNRIKRVRERCPDLLGDNGWRWRVLRTSNAYNFRDPDAGYSSKSEKPTGTTTQDFFSPIKEEIHLVARGRLAAKIMNLAQNDRCDGRA